MSSLWKSAAPSDIESISKILSSISIFGLKIEKEILDLIAECARGKLLNCYNDWCDNEVLVLKEHSCDGIPNREKPKPTRSKVTYGDGRTEIVTREAPPDTQNKIADHSYNDLQFNTKYYYDPENNIAFCADCRKIMKMCGEPVVAPTAMNRYWGRCGCDGIIFDNKPSSYTLCGCNTQKRMCKQRGHSICSRCNHSACGSYGNNDYCTMRECGTCSVKGCLYCIEKVSCDMVLTSMPPQFVNPVYKCKNNECVDIIKTVFNDDKDYVEFKKKCDVLAEILDIDTQNIIIHIAEYATGKIVTCSKKACKREILILNANQCIWTKQQRMGWGMMKKECDTFMDWQDNEMKYFYRPMRNNDIVYCHECIEYIEMCGDGFLEMCGGLIINNDSTTYNVCGCLKKNKICLYHKPCGRCHKYVCHDWSNCDGKTCSKCSYKGCSNCVDSKCKNNGCSKTKPNNSRFNAINFGVSWEPMDND